VLRRAIAFEDAILRKLPIFAPFCGGNPTTNKTRIFFFYQKRKD